jgi:spore coat protein CotF
MKDYVVRIEVDVQVYATDEKDAIKQVSRSTTNWDDWNVTSATPQVKEGDLNDHSN